MFKYCANFFQFSEINIIIIYPYSSDKDDPGKQHVHDDVIFAPAPLDPAKIDKDFECLVVSFFFR